MSTFTERLAELMGSKAHTKSSLSRELGITHTTVARWLKGTKPRHDQSIQLASTLGVTVQWLMTGEGEKKPVNLDDVQRLHGIVSESPMDYNQGSDRWREAYLELAKITPQNTVYGLEILIRVDPPNSKAAIQGLAALAKKNQDQSAKPK